MAQTNFEDYKDDIEKTAARIREQTINGKLYKIQADEDTGLWMILSRGIPLHLMEDRFTVPTSAFKAIEMWERGNKPKVVIDRPASTVVTENPFLEETKREKVAKRKAKLAE